jgi:hypothetical protein
VNNKLPVPVEPHKRKLRVAWKGPGKMRVGGTNTAKHAPTIPMYHAHVRVPVCKVSILWKLQTNCRLSTAHFTSVVQRPLGIFALILTPTRELAFQISQQVEAFGAPL